MTLKRKIFVKNKQLCFFNKQLNLILIIVCIILNNSNEILSMGAKKYIDHEIELTQSVNVQRIETLNKMCQILNISSSLDDLTDAQMDHLLIDRKHKFLYCYVPKVSSFFHGLFLKIKMHAIEKSSVSNLSCLVLCVF